MMWYFLLGCVTISISGLSIDLLLRALNDKGITIRNISRKSRTQMQLTIPKKDFTDFSKIANKHKAKTKVVNRKGIFYKVLAFIRRPILSVGLIAVLVIAIMGDWFVIDLTYCFDVSQETSELLDDVCKDIGIYQGAYKRNWNIDEMEKQILDEVKDLVYVSIKIDGSYVDVEAVEKISGPNADARDEAANVIAKKSCVIQEILLYNGHCMVEVGDVVKKGTLLVSGVVPINDGARYIIVGASADITGRVWYVGTYSNYLYDMIDVETGNTQRCIEIKWGDKVLFSQETDFENYNINPSRYEMLKGIWPITYTSYNYKETIIKKIDIDIEDIVFVTEANALDNAKRKIEEGATIVNTTVNYTIDGDMICAEATIETYEEIGLRIMMNTKE